MLAVQEALVIDPLDDAAGALKRRLMRIQSLQEAFRRARAARRWHTARSVLADCVQLYEEVDLAIPTELTCWKVDLAVFSQDWEDAKRVIKWVLRFARHRTLILTNSLFAAATCLKTNHWP